MNPSNGPRRRRSAQTVAVTLAAVALSACNTGGSGTPSPDAPGGTPQTGGTISVGSGQGAIPQLDPGLATLHWEWVLYPLLWDGLTYLDENSEVQPALAESWTSNENFTEWQFELRDDVEFSNGRALEGDDIVWNIERIIEPENASIAHSYLIAVNGASADGSTVTVSLDEPVVTLPLAISHLRIIAPESLDTINDDPVGTGPFTVASFVPGQALELVRNENYWGEPALLDGINFDAVNDAAAGVTALRSGALDVLWNLPGKEAVALESATDVRIVEPESSGTNHYLFVDNQSPPFDDPRARHALAHSFDRTAVRDTAYSGFGVPAGRNTLIPPGNWAHEESLPEYDLNLDRAAELFEQAGITEGSTLTWWGIAGAYPEWQTEAQLLKANLEEIGINLEIENNEIGTWVDGFLPKGKEFPGYIVPNAGGDVNDPNYLIDRLTGGTFEGNWQSDKLDELAARGAATDDQDERREIYAEAQRLVDEEAPLITSVHTSLLSGVRNEVQGVWTSPAGNLQLDRAHLVD